MCDVISLAVTGSGQQLWLARVTDGLTGQRKQVAGVTSLPLRGLRLMGFGASAPRCEHAKKCQAYGTPGRARIPPPGAGCVPRQLKQAA